MEGLGGEEDLRARQRGAWGEEAVECAFGTSDGVGRTKRAWDECETGESAREETGGGRGKAGTKALPSARSKREPTRRADNRLRGGTCTIHPARFGALSAVNRLYRCARSTLTEARAVHDAHLRARVGPRRLGKVDRAPLARSRRRALELKCHEHLSRSTVRPVSSLAAERHVVLARTGRSRICTHLGQSAGEAATLVRSGAQSTMLSDGSEETRRCLHDSVERFGKRALSSRPESSTPRGHVARRVPPTARRDRACTKHHGCIASRPGYALICSKYCWRNGLASVCSLLSCGTHLGSSCRRWIVRSGPRKQRLGPRTAGPDAGLEAHADLTKKNAPGRAASRG